MGNVFSSSRSRQNERDIEELRQQFQTFRMSTDNRFNQYDAIIEELITTTRGLRTMTQELRNVSLGHESIINELRRLNSDRTNNRSGRREEAENENPAPFPDRERGHHHDGDLVR